MTVDCKIRNEKLQHDINREVTKISVLLSGKKISIQFPNLINLTYNLRGSILQAKTYHLMIKVE